MHFGKKVAEEKLHSQPTSGDCITGSSGVALKDVAAQVKKEAECIAAIDPWDHEQQVDDMIG